MVIDNEADLEVVVEDMFAHLPPCRPEAEVEKVKVALQLLDEAEQPVIVAGGGVTASGARDELIAFAESYPSR